MLKGGLALYLWSHKLGASNGRSQVRLRLNSVQQPIPAEITSHGGAVCQRVASQIQIAQFHGGNTVWIGAQNVFLKRFWLKIVTQDSRFKYIKNTRFYVAMSNPTIVEILESVGYVPSDLGSLLLGETYLLLDMVEQRSTTHLFEHHIELKSDKTGIKML
jgi:hypothetical protein